MEVLVDNVVLMDYELSVISMFSSFVLRQNEIETCIVRRLLAMSGCFMLFLPSFLTCSILLATME